MKRKILCLVCALTLCLTTLAGCSGKVLYKLSYYDEMDPDRGYNENLFYENDMEAACADPTVIYIDDESDKENYGWFYLYPTSDSDFGCHGFSAYRSKDMKSWEYVGPIFDPEEESFAHYSCWAPECIYDPVTKKYYLFFSAEDYNNPDGTLFKNNEEKLEYRDYQADIEEIIEAAESDEAALEQLYAALDELKSFYEGLTAGETAPNGKIYTQEQIDDAKNIISNLNRESEEEVTTKLRDAKTALLSAGTIQIETMYNSRDFGIGVAVSDKPNGPFTQYTNIPGQPGYNAENRTLDVDLPFISNEDIWYWLKEHKSEYYAGPSNSTDPGQMTSGEPITTMIDVHPFVDPKTGEKYLYLVRDLQGGGGSFAFVIKMGEKWTDDPKWETTTRLTRTGYYTVDDMSPSNKSDDLVEGSTNEGPYMYYNAENDKYYLTVSVNSYGSRAYSVIQAIGDSPMGPFRKLTQAEGGRITACEVHWDHISGPGHHSFCTYNGQLYIIYHAHYDRIAGGSQRGSCVDPIVWIQNGNGETIMHCNGPTYSYQPKIGPEMEYVNIAGNAAIKATNIADGSSADLLTDGVIKFYSWDEFINEFTTGKKKKTEITLTYDDYVAVRALMIYNSYDYEYHFESVDRIEMDFVKTVNGVDVEGTAYIDDLRFDTARYINTAVEGEEFMRPGGAAIAEFDELKVKEIRITFNSDRPIAISEIYVLGK